MAEINARPLFVDNQDGNTLARAIKAHLEALRDAGKTPAELCVTSAYFNPQGLELLARELRHVPRIRLLLGAEPTPEALLPRRRPDDPPEPEFTRRRLRASLGRIEEALRADRNRIPFDLEGDRALRTLLDFLHSGRIEVRRYEGHFLHAKAFLFRGEDRGLLSGSSNLTRAGLQSNLELNLGHWDDPLLERVEAWYDTLWDEAVPFDLAAIYEELLADYPPYLLYLKVLWHLYHDELVEEEAETGHIPVTTFQRHGVWRARKILQSYGGVLIADGVGLGKTYTAGEIIRDYRERRQRVLLVCPASLRDTTWKKFLNDYQLLVECLSYEELARDAQLGGRPRGGKGAPAGGTVGGKDGQHTEVGSRLHVTTTDSRTGQTSLRDGGGHRLASWTSGYATARSEAVCRGAGCGRTRTSGSVGGQGQQRPWSTRP